MKTGSFQTIGAAPGRIGISLGSPRGQPAGYRMYKALAPTRDMLSMPLAEYAPRYNALLEQLDPQKVWEDLHKLAGVDAAGNQIAPILLCFERAPFSETNFCHRRQAALWLEEKLGVKIYEDGFEGQDIDVKQAALI